MQFDLWKRELKIACMKQWAVICKSKMLKTMKVLEKCTFKKINLFFSMLPFSFVFNLEVDYCKMFQYSTQSKMILINSGSADENNNDFCETIQNLHSESDLIGLNKFHLETLFTQLLLSAPNLCSNWWTLLAWRREGTLLLITNPAGHLFRL